MKKGNINRRVDLLFRLETDSCRQETIADLAKYAGIRAEEVKVEYVDFTSTPAAGGGADLKWTAQAKGAWGRLTELYLNASAATTVDVYLDSGNALGCVLDGSDFKIASGHAVGTSTTSVGLSYTGAEDVGSNVLNGFVKDSEQELLKMFR